MSTQPPSFEDDANGDLLRRMQASGFDFSTTHDVEFFAVFRTEEEADAVALQQVADLEAGNTLVNIETRPARSGGMELEIVKHMLVTHDNVTTFESLLASRVEAQGGDLDGWGVMQA